MNRKVGSQDCNSDSIPGGKKYTIMRSLLFLSFLLFTNCKAPSIQSNNSLAEVKVISVIDFGAKGDGKTDDTAAIQSAFKFANKQQISRNTDGKGGKTKVYYGSTPVINFPHGSYLISKSIEFGYYQWIQGENAILMPASGFLGPAFGGVGWQLKVEGMQFIGFDSALNVNNNNLDAGQVIIRNCSFLSNSSCINLVAESSLSIIEQCRFVDNKQVLKVEKGDKVVFQDNWVSSGQLDGRHDAQFINYGFLHFDRNLLVPRMPAPGAFEPAWINNYGSVSAIGVRQGGETGSFTLVNNFAEADQAYPVVPNSVVVRDSDCYGVYGNRSDYRQPAVVRLLSVPNLTVCDGIRGATDAVIVEWSESSKRLEIPKNKNFKLKIINCVGGYYPRGFE